MEFDNNLIGMVYNEVHYKRHDAKVFWPDGEVKKPIFEIDVAKNKISEFKDTLYYKFNPEYSSFSECDNEEVSSWRSDYESALRIMNDKRNPEAGENPFYSGSTYRGGRD